MTILLSIISRCLVSLLPITSTLSLDCDSNHFVTSSSSSEERIIVDKANFAIDSLVQSIKQFDSDSVSVSLAEGEPGYLFPVKIASGKLFSGDEFNIAALSKGISFSVVGKIVLPDPNNQINHIVSYSSAKGLSNILYKANTIKDFHCRSIRWRGGPFFISYSNDSPADSENNSIYFSFDIIVNLTVRVYSSVISV